MSPETSAATTDFENVIPLFADGSRGENVNDAYRLERALRRVRKLLNDPVALRLRAQALLDGTAGPLLVLAVVGLTMLRFLGGPLQGPSVYMAGLHYRRVPAVTVAVAPAQGLAS